MKKLLLIPSLLIFSMTAKAQVIAGAPLGEYTDVNPDTLISYTVTPFTHLQYPVDLFGDSNPDIYLVAHGAVSSGGSSAYLRVETLGAETYVLFGRIDSVYAPGSMSFDVTKVAKPLAAGDQLDAPGADWQNGVFDLTNHGGSGGANKDVNDFIGGERFIGVKYMYGSTVAYAWLRVEVPVENELWLKDYSVTSSMVGIADEAANELTIYPNPFNDRLLVKGKNIDREKVQFYNIHGAVVNCASETVNDGITINTSHLAPGCYFLKYNSSAGDSIRKIVKVK